MNNDSPTLESMKEQKTIECRVRDFAKLSRQYKLTSTQVVSKVWNNGMGLLELLYAEDGYVVYNTSIALSRDCTHIQQHFPECKILGLEYGYPTYYQHNWRERALKAINIYKQQKTRNNDNN